MEKVRSLYRVTLFPCQMGSSSRIDQLLLSEFLRLVEKFVKLASIKVEHGKAVETKMLESSIQWSKVVGLVDVIYDCTKKWLIEFSKCTEDSVTVHYSLEIVFKLLAKVKLALNLLSYLL